jgi:hypothetical protein
VRQILSHILIAIVALGVGFAASGRYQVAGDGRAPVKIDRFTGQVWVWKSALEQTTDAELESQVGRTQWVELPIE